MHCNAFIDLINHYKADSMGDGTQLSLNGKVSLIEGMRMHPSSFAMFALLQEEIVGMVTCFVNFSTFRAKPFLNIHDIIVREEYRGKRIGKKLLEKCIELAMQKGYCKVTLEVRDDNFIAKSLYKNLGFEDTNPAMHYMTKKM